MVVILTKAYTGHSSRETVDEVLDLLEYYIIESLNQGRNWPASLVCFSATIIRHETLSVYLYQPTRQ